MLGVPYHFFFPPVFPSESCPFSFSSILTVLPNRTLPSCGKCSFMEYITWGPPIRGFPTTCRSGRWLLGIAPCALIICFHSTQSPPFLLGLFSCQTDVVPLIPQSEQFLLLDLPMLNSRVSHSGSLLKCRSVHRSVHNTHVHGTLPFSCFFQVGPFRSSSEVWCLWEWLTLFCMWAPVFFWNIRLAVHSNLF